MKKITTTLALAALTLAPTTVLAEPATAKETPATEAKAEEKKADQEIVVTCNDTMQFDNKEIEVKVGTTIKLTLKNVGKVPKVAMGHNLVILKPGTNPVTWAGKAMTARETDFIPTEEADKEAIFAHTKLLGPDEEDSITFEVKEAGEYEFLCSFPGHSALMKGKIIAK